MAEPSIHPLLFCRRERRQPHMDWYDQDDCSVTARDGVPFCYRETDTPHESQWRCAICDDVRVQRPSERANALDAVCGSG